MLPRQHGTRFCLATALSLAILAASAWGEEGKNPVLEAARRHVASWGDDGDSLAVVRRAGAAAWTAVKTAYAEGRTYAQRPRGRTAGRARLGHDPGFHVDYVLYVPESYDPSKPTPLVLYVHGTGSTGDGALRRVLPALQDAGWILLCPTCEIVGRGWTSTFYERRMQLDALALVRRHYNVDPLRIYMGGFSRGGHASWGVPIRNPDVFAATFPMAGGPRLKGFRFLRNLLHTKLRAAWGEKDEWGMVWCDREAVNRLKALGYAPVVRERPDTGHAFRPDWPAIRAWLAPRVRPRLPRRVVLAADDEREGRAYWLEVKQLGRKSKLPAAGKGTMVLGGKKRPVVIGGVPTPRGFDKRPQEERWQHFVDKADPYCGVLEGDWIGSNEVRVKATRVKRFALLVPDELVDWEKPLRVVVNGKTAFRGAVKPDPAWAVARLARSADWSVLYGCAVEVRVRGVR